MSTKFKVIENDDNKILSLLSYCEGIDGRTLQLIIRSKDDVFNAKSFALNVEQALQLKTAIEYWVSGRPLTEVD
jgi:hypothetical protein